jgi:Protein of unknown function (DUF1214)
MKKLRQLPFSWLLLSLISSPLPGNSQSVQLEGSHGNVLREKRPIVIYHNNVFEVGDHFLVEDNPLATSDQLAMEALSLQILEAPQVQKAREIAAMKVRSLVDGRAPEEAWKTFDERMDEWTLGYVQKAVNADPNYPKVLTQVYSGAYEWFGRKMPANRAFGGDNPDTIYGMIPVDPYARYRLIGKKFNDKFDAPVQLASNLSLSSTLGMISWEEMQFEHDGTFVITIDPEPANGRANHIQSSPDAKFVLLRYTRSDWSAKPLAYRVERLDAPLAAPLTFDQLAERAALYVVDDIPASVYWLSMVDELEFNSFKPIFTTGQVGGMWTARMSFAKLALEDDEAYVLTISLADARFFNLVLMDYWQDTIDYGRRLTSSNDIQANHNPDGTITFVISKQDPGVYNWIDTTGLKYPKVMLRWQQLPKDPNAKAPELTGKLVKLKRLKDELPESMKYVSDDAREKQIRKRIKSHQTRYLDK